MIAVQHFGLAGVVLVFADHLDAQPRIAGERVAVVVEPVRRFQTSVDRLEARTAPVGRLQHLDVAP